jgi:hypothetical protein
MKILFPIFCILLSSSIQAQMSGCNDWFDMNLKNRPKIVKELSLVSFDFFIDPKSSWYQNSSVKQMISIDEYHFDSLGFISKEFHKGISDTIGDWIEYKEYVKYNDSIVIKGYSTVGNHGSFKEKRLIDKNGYLIGKIILMDTIQYLRNSKKKIERRYEHLIGIDSPEEKETKFEYNDNGDIIKEISNEEILLPSDPKSAKSKTVTVYQYIYDSNCNWVIRLKIVDNEIVSITQREVKN